MQQGRTKKHTGISYASKWSTVEKVSSHRLRKFKLPLLLTKEQIKEKSSKVLADQQGIRIRWREYTEELYASTRDPEPPHDDPVELEPAILDEEVVWALKQLPKNKATGIDCIPAEMLRAIPPVAITAICQKIWETSRRPKD